MSQNFEIHVISLKNQTQRREKIEAILEGQGLKWSFFDAIAGGDISIYLGMYDREKRLRNLGYDLRINEIACFISHRTLWEACVRQGVPFLILEDDIKINQGVGDFAQAAQIVHLIIEKIKPEYLFVRLGNLFDRKFQVLQKISDDFDIVRYQRDPSTAMGYIISPQVAEILLAQSEKFFCAVDNYMWRGWEHGCCLLDVSPALFFTSDADTPSSIGDRSKPAIGLLKKIKREYFRALDGAQRSRYEKKIIKELLKHESNIFN
jgi:glycosyl transferase, family 25